MPNRVKLENKNIIVVSNEPWGEVWYSKHNYAYELSKRNRVVFVDPCKKWSFLNLFKRKISSYKVSESLEVLQYNNFLPSRILNTNNRIVSRRIRKYLSRQDIHDPVFWSFDPFRLFEPQLITEGTIILHLVDKFRFANKAEDLICKNSEFMITCSSEITEAYKKYNKPTLTIPHGISKEEFFSDSIPDDVDANSNYGLYVGGIDHRLDYALIQRMLESNLETEFVFIGPLNLPEQNVTAHRLFSEGVFTNLRWLGPRPFKELKHYISSSGFCLAPMEQTVNGNTISHHKIFQYMAFGKPVFSIEFSEYRSFAHLLHMDNNPNQLVAKLTDFIHNGEDSEKAGSRIEKAKTHTYEALFQEIEEFLGNHI